MPKRIATHMWGTVIAVALLLVFVPHIFGSTVRHGLSSQDSWVGTPITLTVVFENVESHTAPQLPDVPGLRMTSAGQPSTSVQTQWINGHQSTQRSLAYRFLIDATAPGTYQIPALTMQADGVTYRTEPASITFISANNPDLMDVAITGVPEQAWVGDQINATLQIRVKPYRNSMLPNGGVLSAAEMWRQVDLDNSAWGPFRETLVELVNSRRAPAMRLDKQGGPGGVEDWYAYDINAQIPLTHAGPLDLSDIRIDMRYPTEIGRGRGSLFDPFPTLDITSVRPVTASPAETDVRVNEPPTAGRPAGWTGAVGQFSLDVSASPTDVVVGEPITLTMRIRDEARRPSDLNRLQPPDLAIDTALTEHFRIPSDHPGGIVDGHTKTFTQTIRPTSVRADLIPPITFPYFDPASGAYDVAVSRPINLTITSAASLDASDIAPVQASAVPKADAVTAVEGGLLANYTNPQQLLTRTRRPTMAWVAGALLAPPVILTIIGGGIRRRMAARANPLRQRSREAYRTWASSTSAPHQTAEAVAHAIRVYVAARLQCEATLTGREAVGKIRDRLDDDHADELDTLLQQLERATYAGGGGGLTPDEFASARTVIDRIEEAIR